MRYRGNSHYEEKLLRELCLTQMDFSYNSDGKIIHIEAT